MNARALLLTGLLLLVTIPAAAETIGDRALIRPTAGHITFGATAPWNSIDATVSYGGTLGVKVNRWFGINSSIGYAFANGNFGWVEDGTGGFEETTNSGKDVDVLTFGIDLSFHPMEGRLDPWALVGWTMMNYDFDFDSTGFGDWLSENGATWNLADLHSATGWQFGLGCGYAFRTTEHTAWSVTADFRDMMVSSKNLEIISSTGETILDSSYGHNLLFNIGIEFSWGNYPVETEPVETEAAAETADTEG